MKAVCMRGYGGPDVLYLGDAPDPICGPDDLLVAVRATALNRADLLQRRGLYPPPPGASDILGLEMAGEVIQVGERVLGWRPGDRVCALLPGGGYAERAVVPAAMAMRIPDGLSYEQAAAIPEVFLTAYLNLFWLGGLRRGQTVLVHAGASGVGTAAIQLIRAAGAQALVTAGSDEKVAFCCALGARAGWNYHQGSFAPWVLEQTGGRGVDLILDFVGAPYFADNLQSLATDGRLIVIGTLGGSKVNQVDLGRLLQRRQHIIGTALRSRPLAEKVRLTQEFAAFALRRFADGRLVPVIDRVFDWSEAAAAHAYMESNANIGKIVLRVTGARAGATSVADTADATSAAHAASFPSAAHEAGIASAADAAGVPAGQAPPATPVASPPQGPKRLTEDEVAARLAALPAWQLADGRFIQRRYRFATFPDALSFANMVGALAEAFHHHPFIQIDYKYVTLRLTTWHAGGLTATDFDEAAACDAVYRAVFSSDA